MNNGELSMMAVKVVDDILFASKKERLVRVIDRIGREYKLGTIVYGPGKFLFYGLEIAQDEDFSIRIHGDEKLQSYLAPTIDRIRRKQHDDSLNSIELSAFRSLNSSLGWLGTAASPFCAHAARSLQQKGPLPLVKDLVSQHNVLKSLKQEGTMVRYIRPTNMNECQVSLVIFADARRTSDYGQLGYVAGLLFGELKEDAVFHIVSWSSHKSRRPVKSIGSAETLAAGEEIDEGKVLAKAYTKLLGVTVQLWVIVDSKDLYATLSTCRNATDRSIRGDISVIRYEYETKIVDRMIWTPGRSNFADPLTKPDSPMSKPLELTMYNGMIAIDFSKALYTSSDKSTG